MIDRTNPSNSNIRQIKFIVSIETLNIESLKKGATFILDRKSNRGRFDLDERDEIFCLLRKVNFLATFVYRETRES